MKQKIPLNYKIKIITPNQKLKGNLKQHPPQYYYDTPTRIIETIQQNPQEYKWIQKYINIINKHLKHKNNEIKIITPDYNPIRSNNNENTYNFIGYETDWRTHIQKQRKKRTHNTPISRRGTDKH